MKKLSVVLVTAALFTSTISGASAATPAISNTKQIPIVKITNGIWAAETFSLSGGRTLVAWAEAGKSNALWFRTRIMNSKDKFGKVIQLNKAAAFSALYQETAPKIVANKKGMLFAAWIKRTKKGSTVTDQIIGRTSTNGTTWSKEFAATKPLKVTGTRCDDFDSPNCGYLRHEIAIDESGRLAVLVGSSSARFKVDFRVSATRTSSKWPTPKSLGTVREQRATEIVGLSSGFAVSYTDYTGKSCATRVALFNAKTSKWSATMTAQNIPVNTVVYSKWVQRDSNTLSIITNSEIEQGGIGIRDYSLKTRKWLAPTKNLAPSEESVVFQNLQVGTKGTSVAIGYTTYNQVSGMTQHRMILLSSKTAAAQNIFFEEGQVGGNPRLAGFRKSGLAFAIFNQHSSSTILTQFSPAFEPWTISGAKENSYFLSIAVTPDDVLLGTEITGPDGNLSLTLIKGKLN
jgi:hypothetical protein